MNPPPPDTRRARATETTRSACGIFEWNLWSKRASTLAFRMRRKTSVLIVNWSFICCWCIFVFVKLEYSNFWNKLKKKSLQSFIKLKLCSFEKENLSLQNLDMAWEKIFFFAQPCFEKFLLFNSLFRVSSIGRVSGNVDTRSNSVWPFFGLKTFNLNIFLDIWF
jgi:hypothetical protein